MQNDFFALQWKNVTETQTPKKAKKKKNVIPDLKLVVILFLQILYKSISLWLRQRFKFASSEKLMLSAVNYNWLFQMFFKLFRFSLSLSLLLVRVCVWWKISTSWPAEIQLSVESINWSIGLLWSYIMCVFVCMDKYGSVCVVCM